LPALVLVGGPGGRSQGVDLHLEQEHGHQEEEHQRGLQHFFTPP
jgi:hypothetical protein